jgi:hypothetical protein
MTHQLFKITRELLVGVISNAALNGAIPGIMLHPRA